MKEKLKERIDELEKAQHTATSDPTSKKDINVVGDMEIDSDSESQGDEAPPTEPHPSVQFPTNQFIPPQGVTFPSNEFTPSPFPTPPAVQNQAFPLTLSNPSSLPSLPPRPPPFTHVPPPSNIPYSPSMPKHFSPLTPPTGLRSLPPFPNPPPLSNPMIDHKPGIAPPSSSHSQVTAPGESVTNLENRLKNLVTTKTLPESLFQDYSDSDSELDENDKPYSPSSMVLISPMKKKDNSTDFKEELAEDTGPDKPLSSDENNSIHFYGSGDYIDKNILPSKPDTGQADTGLPTSDSINPDDIKITPSLTQLLGQIFPQLSKSLENQRKRKNDDQDNNMMEESSKHPKTESTVKTEGLQTLPDIPVQSSTTGGILAPPAPPSIPLYPNHTQPHLFPQPPFNNTSPFPPPPPQFRYPGPPQMFLSPQENMRPPPNWSNRFHSQTPPPSLRPRYF